MKRILGYLFLLYMICKIVKQQQESRQIDEFERCVKARAAMKVDTTMNQIECYCNKTLGTSYGTVCE